MTTGYEWGPEATREIGGISTEGIVVDVERNMLSFGIHIIPELNANWASALAAVVRERDNTFAFSMEIPAAGKRVILRNVPIQEEAIVDAWIAVEDFVKRANHKYEEIRTARNQALDVLERAGARIAPMRPAYLSDNSEG